MTTRLAHGVAVHSQDAELAGRWTAEMMLAALAGTTPQILQRLRPAALISRCSVAPPMREPAALAELIRANAAEDETETGGREP